MITYVNTVLVTNKNNTAWAEKSDVAEMTAADKDAEIAKRAGKPIFFNYDAEDPYSTKDVSNVNKFKIGVITNDTTIVRKKDGSVKYVPVVKWSNDILAHDIKSLTLNKYTDDVEDTVTIDFSKVDEATQNLFKEGGCTIVVRLTFKDMDTRYRKWTESYSYVTESGDKITDIVKKINDQINREYRRARVTAEIANGAADSDNENKAIKIVAMKYDDDEQAVTENVYGKVRFDANAYYSNSKAPGWASNNKYDIAGLKITKAPGKTSPTSAKLVRDRERASFDYMGVLHRCCWYDPQPKMITDINAKYTGITLEFENQYHTADDLMRQTKQTVELYATNNGAAGNLDTIFTTLKTIADSIAGADVHEAAEAKVNAGTPSSGDGNNLD